MHKHTQRQLCGQVPILCALILALAAVCAPRVALAQDSAACSDGSGLAPVPGLVPFKTARDAEATGATLFGAVSTLERKVVPMMGDTNKRFPYAVHFGSTSLYSAVQVPITAQNRCLGLSGDDDTFGVGFGSAPLDIHALNFGISYRLGDHFSLLYASSAVTSQLAPTGEDRFLGAGLTLLSGSFITLSAPILLTLGIDTFEDGFTRTVYDYVAAASFAMEDVGELHLGYVGSEGIYTNINQRNLHIFGRAVLSESFARVPLLEAGLEALPLLDTRQSLFARRLQYFAPRDTSEDAPPVDEAAEESKVDFWTVHYEGLDLWSYVDVHFALSLSPDVIVHNARLTVHGVGFNPDYSSSSAFRETGLFWGAYIGLLETPNVPFYGVEGGKRLEAGVIASVPIDDRARFFMTLALNDREMLAAFPYAANSLHVSFGFEGLERK